jgi:hypothetical protein
MPRNRKTWALYLYVVSDSGGGSIDPPARADVKALMKAVRTKAGRSCHVEVRADFAKGRSVHATSHAPMSLKRVKEASGIVQQTLRDFFDDAIRDTPSSVRHVALMFWGHSVGPGGLFEDENSGAKARSDDGRLNLPLHEVSNAVFHARKVLKARNTSLAMAIFKNCAMATVETAVEFQGTVPFLIASQDLVPAAGWPWRRLLAGLRGRDARAASRRVLAAVRGHFALQENRPGRAEVMFSLIDARRGRRRLTGAFTKLREAIEEARPINNDRARRAAMQAYPPSDPCLLDVGALCENLRLFAGAGSPLGRQARRVQNVCSRMLVDPPEDGATQFTGISVLYVPRVTRLLDLSFIQLPTMYSQLRFAQETGWESIATENIEGLS